MRTVQELVTNVDSHARPEIMLIGNFLDKSTFKHLIEHCVLPGSAEGDEVQPVATMDVPSHLPE
jgi:hypothetical protein